MPVVIAALAAATGVTAFDVIPPEAMRSKGYGHIFAKNFISRCPMRKQIEARAAKEGISVDAATVALVGEKQPSERFVTPEHLAELALFLTTDAGGSITGSAYTMDGGWTAQ